MAEAILVHELIEKNVPMRVLRPVIEGLRSQLGDWPLQHARLETLSNPDITVAALLVREGEKRFELGSHGWQLVEHTTISPSASYPT